MKTKYQAEIKFDTLSNHPDKPNTKGMKFADIYSIDPDIFTDDPQSYIRHDLKLVAGGGYKTDTITNVQITIKQV